MVSRNCASQLRVKLIAAFVGSTDSYFIYFYTYIVCDCARNKETRVGPTTVYNLRFSGAQQVSPLNASSETDKNAS